MMKIKLYNISKDEEAFVKEAKKLFNVDLTTSPIMLSSDGLPSAYGFDAVLVNGGEHLNKEQLQELKDHGTQIVVVRSAGFDKVDVKAGFDMGLEMANVPAYSPNAISEFTVGLTLSLLREMNQIAIRAHNFEYPRPLFPGKELRTSTVGIIGGGHIGEMSAKAFHGFGANVLVHDAYEKDSIKEVAKYVDLDTLYKTSDIICLHCPLNEETYHIIDEKSLSKMKDGVMIINTARGGLVDAKALLAALESGKVSKAGLDVYEYEEGIFWVKGRSGEDDKIFKALNENPNVFITPHIAYFTEEAIKNMIVFAVENAVTFEKDGVAKYTLKNKV